MVRMRPSDGRFLKGTPAASRRAHASSRLVTANARWPKPSPGPLPGWCLKSGCASVPQLRKGSGEHKQTGRLRATGSHLWVSSSVTPGVAHSAACAASLPGSCGADAPAKHGRHQHNSANAEETQKRLPAGSVCRKYRLNFMDGKSYLSTCSEQTRQPDVRNPRKPRRGSDTPIRQGSAPASCP